MTLDSSLDRRTFLARIGLLGAAVGTGGLVPANATAQTVNPLPDLVALLRPVLAELARDTLNGLTAFVFPGPDEYSAAQGTPRDEPGAAEAKTTEFMIAALDNFVPFPDRLAQPIAAAVATGTADSGIPLPGIEQLPQETATLDDALGALLENDATIPLSLSIAGMLNLVATQVNPAAVNGAFLSPFARLSYTDKAQVFQRIEQANSDLVAMLDAEFPEPSKDAVSGLLKFVGGALLEFVAYGSLTEWAVLTEDKRLTARPVGWDLTGYLPDGPVEGWDDFKGYYQGRREVHD
ncbi:hypothetical protein [Haloechinothrix salitolerans]|uniref:Tat (Twin-arginine translocation) pathway signal sequence n=1 Tax=Haloechinothrix salitolerans TaxID=926830 RepID=A0ABW2BYH5_9PSEU